MQYLWKQSQYCGSVDTGFFAYANYICVYIYLYRQNQAIDNSVHDLAIGLQS